jgi:hypothetical protein
MVEAKSTRPPDATAPLTPNDPQLSSAPPAAGPRPELPPAVAAELARLHELAADAREGRQLWMRHAREARAAGDAQGIRTCVARAALLSRAVRRHKAASRMAKRLAHAPRLATRLILKHGAAYAVLALLNPHVRRMERAPCGTHDAQRLPVWRRVWLEVQHQGTGEVRP